MREMLHGQVLLLLYDLLQLLRLLLLPETEATRLDSNTQGPVPMTVGHDLANPHQGPQIPTSQPANPWRSVMRHGWISTRHRSCQKAWTWAREPLCEASGCSFQYSRLC